MFTNTVPRDTVYIRLLATSLTSEHFKARGKYIYLTPAYNQNSRRFNNKVGGHLRLSSKEISRIEVTFNLENMVDFFTLKHTFSMNFKVLENAAKQRYVLFADGAKAKFSSDLVEFGMQKRASAGIKPKDAAIMKGAAVGIFLNDVFVPEIIDGTRTLPPDNALMVEIQTLFLPGIMSQALIALTAQLVGKEKVDGTPLLEEELDAALKAVLASEDQANAYSLSADIVSDLLQLYELGEKADDSVALCLSEMFGLNPDTVRNLVTVKPVGADAEDAAEAIDLGDEVADETSAAASKDGDKTAPVITDTKKAELEDLVERTRRHANYMLALRALFEHGEAEATALKLEVEKAAGVDHAAVVPMLGNGTPVKETEEVTV